MEISLRFFQSTYFLNLKGRVMPEKQSKCFRKSMTQSLQTGFDPQRLDSGKRWVSTMAIKRITSGKVFLAKSSREMITMAHNNKRYYSSSRGFGRIFEPKSCPNDTIGLFALSQPAGWYSFIHSLIVVSVGANLTSRVSPVRQGGRVCNL